MIKIRVMPLVIPIILLFLCGNVKAIELYNKENSVVTFDGNVNATHLISKNKDNDGDFSFFHLGFKGETKLTENLIAYGRWQYHFANRAYETTKHNHLENNTRLAYVGFKYGKLGSFDYGRNIGLVHKTTSVTDMFRKFNSIDKRNEGFISGRSGSVATYYNKDFFGLIKGLDFGIQYQGKNHFTVGRSSSLEANGEGYALYTSYNYNNLTFSGSFANIGRIDIQNKLKYGRGERAQLWATSLKYDIKPLYLAASYSENLNATPIANGFANKTKNLSFLAQSKLLNGTLRPAVSYVTTVGQNIEEIEHDIDLHKYIGFGSSYFLNKNISVYAEYKFNLLNQNPRNNEDKVKKLNLIKDNVATLGFNYRF